MDQKKTFLEPELEVVRIQSGDVISTSSTKTCKMEMPTIWG